MRLAAADLHNHSLFSDGRGDPQTAFAQMRAAGLDVAALTDHSSIPLHAVDGLSLEHYPHSAALAVARTPPRSIDETDWKRTAEFADAHDVPGEFTALRGFEWTEPWLGHVNVWFSDAFVPVTSPGSLADLFAFLDGAEPEALFGYNHPGREPGELAGFARPPGELSERLSKRMVTLEVFNRREDFLFSPRGDGTSPLAACLDAGWRPALIGCSDEHGRDYGLAGKGRTGLWVPELSRGGVREALLARRAFATREVGLVLDARLDGVRGGGDLMPGGGGRCELMADLSCPGLDGAEVELQLITGYGDLLDVLDRRPALCGEVTEWPVEVPEHVPWLVLRVADPTSTYTDRLYGPVAPPGHLCANWALAYASPWFRATSP